jgi:hypothetical protein
MPQPLQPGPAGAPAAGAPPAPPPLPRMVILSYAYWQHRFGGRADIIGRPMPGARQGGSQIVGVLKPGFELFFPADVTEEALPDVWFANRLAYDNAERNQVSLRDTQPDRRRSDSAPAGPGSCSLEWTIPGSQSRPGGRDLGTAAAAAGARSRR